MSSRNMSPVDGDRDDLITTAATGTYYLNRNDLSLIHSFFFTIASITSRSSMREPLSERMHEPICGSDRLVGII